MSAPTPPRPGRTSFRRWRTGSAVAVAVAVVALVVLALLPRTATAAASLTVTPRTDAGADAAVLLADRYTTLAGSVATLRTARDGDRALAGVPLDELTAGTEVERTPGTATITIRVTLADRRAAVAAANAVVDALVEAGADEELVDVGRGGEATAARASTSPDLLRWAPAAALLALVCGLATAALTARSRRPAPVPAAAPTEVLDDLPGFLENPPGSPPALPAPTAAPAPVGALVDPSRTGPTAVPAGEARPLAALSRRGAAGATVTAGVLLMAVATLVGVAVGRSGHAPGTAAAVRAGDAPTGRPGSAAPGPDATVPTTSAPTSAVGTPAGALAFESVPLGGKGMAASATFQGVVLEQRAVGLTVTYPSVSVTTDGRRSLAHVRLPTFNCLTAEPPTDPVAAGCARSVTEYADLAGPGLRVGRDGERIDLVGLFPTYTRPNGSAPAYTGRAYRLTAAISADGPGQDGRVPASGVVRIGLDSAPTAADRGVNLLQLPG